MRRIIIQVASVRRVPLMGAGTGTMSLIGMGAMLGNGRKPVPSSHELREVWEGVLSGRIPREWAALWAEQWVDHEPPDCTELQREVLDCLSLATAPDADHSFLFEAADLEEWSKSWPADS